jgi:hypothetical protein
MEGCASRGDAHVSGAEISKGSWVMRLKQVMVFMTTAVAVGFFLLPGQAIAGPEGMNLNWGHQLTASETACPSGELVLKVVRKIKNSVDSGTGTNDDGRVWWANIDYVQHIQVVETELGKFCATLKSQGSFESVGGDGPGCVNDGNCTLDEGRLAAEVVGTFQGGMTQSFTGIFLPGSQRVKGNIGTLDHGCDASTEAGCTFSGFSKWRFDYFTDVTGIATPWWGWVYHAGDNGSWVNSAPSNEGNIAGD